MFFFNMWVESKSMTKISIPPKKFKFLIMNDHAKMRLKFDRCNQLVKINLMQKTFSISE